MYTILAFLSAVALMTDFHGPFEYYIVRFVGWTGCMQQISDKVIRLSGYSRVLFQITAGFLCKFVAVNYIVVFLTDIGHICAATCIKIVLNFKKINK